MDHIRIRGFCLSGHGSRSYSPHSKFVCLVHIWNLITYVVELDSLCILRAKQSHPIHHYDVIPGGNRDRCYCHRSYSIRTGIQS